MDTEHDLEFELDVVVRKVTTDRWLRLPELVGGDHEGIRREMDVAYHQGKFYYMATSGQVWVVDMAVPSPSPVPLDVLEPPFNGMVMCRGYHLAFSGDGALHVVWSRSAGDGYPWSCNLRDMAVMRFDPEASGEEQWTPARSIVGRARSSSAIATSPYRSPWTAMLAQNYGLASSPRINQRCTIS